MANIVEAALAWAGVYKIEKADLVLGGDGLGDIANKQAHALIKRDNFLRELIKINVQDLIPAILQAQTGSDLVILNGIKPFILSTTTISNDTLTWAEGTIAYSGSIYRVAGGSTVRTGAETFVFKLNNAVDPVTIYLDNGATGSGIADYDESTVKLASDVMAGEWNNVLVGSLQNGWNFTGDSSAILRYKKDMLGNVTVYGNVKSPSSSPSAIMFTLPTGFRPSSAVFVRVSFVGIQAGLLLQGSIDYDGKIAFSMPNGDNIATNTFVRFHFSFSTK
jgi:hypothetical protein